MKTITYSLLVAVLAVSTAVIAQTNLPDQQADLDSLYAVWQDQTQPDSTRTKAYKDYIWQGYLFSNPDTAFVLAQELVTYAQKKQHPKTEALAYNLQGISHAIRGNYPQALNYYQHSLKINEEIGDKKGISAALNNIGNIYKAQSNYVQALSYYQRSLKIKEEIGKKNGIANSLNNIGIIYKNQGNYPKALNYYQHSLKIKEEIGEKSGIANSLNNIGLIYNDQGNFSQALDHHERSLKINEEIGSKKGISAALNNIGDIYKDQGNYPQALNYYQRSLKIKEEIGDKRGIANLLSNIGLIYNDQGNFSQALDHHQRSLKINEEIGDKNGIALTLNNIGGLYQKQGNHAQAITYCQRSLTINEEIGSIAQQKEACYCLYEAHKALGKGNKALEYHEKMLVLEDSLNTEETAKKLQQMEFAKEMLADSLKQEEEKLKVKMAHQQEVAKKDKTRNMLLGGGIFLLLLAISLYSRVRYVRKANMRISKEKDRSENLLLNILPAEIAEELKEKGEAEARDFDLVSILFTDFKGFTQLSETLSAADLVAEINVCFKAFDGIVGKYNIEKIKTIGDAYMCAGGLPVPDDNAVTNTLKAGLEMQAFMIARKSERDAAGLSAFEMRVGIHTGPVVAGIVGVKKFQYDIWGDTVNTASRMESSSEVGQVNISEVTYELVKDNSEFGFTSRGKVEAKGKGEMEMYFVSAI